MSDPDATPVAMPAESARDELVERLKKENAELMENVARSNARAGIFEEKERARVAAWQPEAQYFMKEFIIEAAADDADAKADMAPLAAWADEYAAKKDITSQTPLARMCYVASKAVKRTRDKASKYDELNAQQADSFKKIEELEQKNTKLQRDFDEQVELNSERQKSLEVLNGKIVALGGAQEKFDFSKLASREVSPPVAEPHQAVGGGAPALEAVKAEASKAGMARGGNPLESSGDLLNTLLSRSSAGLRMQASGTAHSFLGGQNADGTDIAAILRM